MILKKELTALWRSLDFKPSKRLGQNFLIDANVKDKIIRQISPHKEDNLLEIGPGFGELTLDIAGLAGKVTAVEKDRRIAKILREVIFSGRQDIEVAERDILDYEIDKGFNKIVGNLPYYITTPVIEKLIRLMHRPDIYVMVQREYADRMTAGPGGKDYSSLSVFVQSSSAVEKLFGVSRTCFYPEPAVDSVFLHMKVLDRPRAPVRDSKLFNAVVRAAFGQRRKTLRSSLCGQDIVRMDKDKFGALLEKLGLGYDARAENLSIDEYARLSDLISEIQGDAACRRRQ